jgi:hypothetical protein
MLLVIPDLDHEASGSRAGQGDLPVHEAQPGAINLAPFCPHFARLLLIFCSALSPAHLFFTFFSDFRLEEEL